MMLGMLLFWVLLVVAAVWLAGVLFPGARRATAEDRPRGSADVLDPAASSPLAVAAERYARGEIAREEYLQLQADLSR